MGASLHSRKLIVSCCCCHTCESVRAGVPDQSWDESAPAGTGFGQDAPAAPAGDDWGAAPAAGAAGQSCLLHLEVNHAIVCRILLSYGFRPHAVLKQACTLYCTGLLGLSQHTSGLYPCCNAAL